MTSRTLSIDELSKFTDGILQFVTKAYVRLPNMRKLAAKAIPSVVNIRSVYFVEASMEYVSAKPVTTLIRICGSFFYHKRNLKGWLAGRGLWKNLAESRLIRLDITNQALLPIDFIPPRASEKVQSQQFNLQG